MELYNQEPEIELLAMLRPHLDGGTVLDVGAERGGFFRALRACGYSGGHLVEASPSNVSELRREFDADPAVTIHPLAAGATDGQATLHLAEDLHGEPIPAFNTAREQPVADAVRFSHRVEVPRRSLQSLVAEGLLPDTFDLVKIDVEGLDLEVMDGMGPLGCKLLMVELWLDVPSVGPCPWTLEDLRRAAGRRGLDRLLFVHHRNRGGVVLVEDEAEPAAGEYGNVVFLSSDLAARARDTTAIVARRLAREAETIDTLADAAAERLSAIEGLEQYRISAQAQIRELQSGRAPAEAQTRAAHAEIARLNRHVAELNAGGGNSSLGRVLTPIRRRIAFWRAVRLGVLRQHAPQPLRLPRGYARTRAPSPAPTISIVTPSFEQARYLERTIASVLGQGYPALDYVVQDGGSTDGSQEILERHRDRLSRAESRPDGGQADAINRGFANGNGEIMAWLNSDDLLLPGALNYVARHFAGHPETDVVYGHRLMIDAEGRKIGNWALPAHDDETLRYRDYVPQETLFWRRSIWERTGGRIDEQLQFALDWDLLLRFLAAGARFVRLPRYLGAFRVHEEAKTVTRIGDVGAAEVSRLRERVHGRPVSEAEAAAASLAYERRHVSVHTAHRVLERLPLPRDAVPWANAGD